MTPLVLDCSVTMAWCFEDEADDYSDAAIEAVAAGTGLVPAIWPLEVANTLLAAERRKRLRPADSARFAELVGALPLRVEEGALARAAGSVIGLAREHRLSAYDAAYLELALRTGSPLASRDRALRRACRKAGGSLFEA